MVSPKITQKTINLGKRIKRLRNKAGLSQEELANNIGVSQTFIGLIEVGRRNPSLKSLNKIASALKVKTKDLLPY